MHNTLNILVVVSCKAECRLNLSDSESVIPGTLGLAGVINSFKETLKRVLEQGSLVSQTVKMDGN